VGDVDYADSLERSHRRALLQLFSIIFSIAKRATRSRMAEKERSSLRRFASEGWWAREK
jgi:hypothetical protein